MKIILKSLLITFVSSVLLSSCSSTSGLGGAEVQAPIVPLSCIAVLPANTSVEKDHTIKYKEASSLEKGAAFATTVLQQELAGQTKVRLLSQDQIDTLVPEIEGGFSGTVAALGRRVNCEGVLVTTVRRFKQREGTELASEAGASVDLQMVLRHSKNSAVLWSADFRETQESFLKNIFSYDKMQSRGFRWITVEQLTEQGIKQRLDECPYL